MSASIVGWHSDYECHFFISFIISNRRNKIMDMKSNTLQMYIRFFIISPPSFWLEADTQSKYPYILYNRKIYKTPPKKNKKTRNNF